jgi:MFS family permease
MAYDTACTFGFHCVSVYSTPLMHCLTIFRTFGSSVYTPAYQEVAKHFGVSNVAALLGVSLYVVGLGFGPILAAPISETYGRRIVYRVSLPLSMLFTLGAGFSKSFATLLVCRFLAGTTGSPVLAVGAGTNADLFPPKARAAATSCFLLAPFLGPALGCVVLNTFVHITIY